MFETKPALFLYENFLAEAPLGGSEDVKEYSIYAFDPIDKALSDIFQGIDNKTLFQLFVYRIGSVEYGPLLYFVPSFVEEDSQFQLVIWHRDGSEGLAEFANTLALQLAQDYDLESKGITFECEVKQ